MQVLLPMLAMFYLLPSLFLQMVIVAFCNLCTTHYPSCYMYRCGLGIYYVGTVGAVGQ